MEHLVVGLTAHLDMEVGGGFPDVIECGASLLVGDFWNQMEVFERRSDADRIDQWIDSLFGKGKHVGGQACFVASGPRLPRRYACHMFSSWGQVPIFRSQAFGLCFSFGGFPGRIDLRNESAPMRRPRVGLPP